MGDVLDLFLRYKDAFLGGLGVTVRLALCVWVLGLVLGILLGWLSIRAKKLVGVPVSALAFALSATPVLVFLFWVHYPFQAILGRSFDPFYTTVLVLGCVNVFSVAQLVSAALKDFPEQYVLAARVCGLSPWATFRSVQMPLAIRQLIPALLPAQVVMLHATLFASLISVDEVFRISQRINAIEYKPVAIYSALAVLFLVTCLPLNGFAVWYRKRYTRNVSER